MYTCLGHFRLGVFNLGGSKRECDMILALQERIYIYIAGIVHKCLPWQVKIGASCVEILHVEIPNFFL